VPSILSHSLCLVLIELKEEKKIEKKIKMATPNILGGSALL
jgi:hypothetical protein